MRQRQLIDMDADLVDRPLDSDILCGKNKICMDHPGSRAFRSVIEEHAVRYRDADSKFDKMNITKEIYEQLNEDSSRFLKYNPQLQAWEKLSCSHVRDKIGHALRFANKRKGRNNSSSSSTLRRGAATTKTNTTRSQKKKNTNTHKRIGSSQSETSSQSSSPGTKSDDDSVSGTSLVAEEVASVTTTSTTTEHPAPLELSTSSSTGMLALPLHDQAKPALLSPAISFLDSQNNNSSVHQDQIPLAKLTPSFSRSSSGGSSSRTMMKSQIPRSISFCYKDSMFPARVPEQYNSSNSSSIKRESLLTPEDRDLFLIMQEPLMEFDPQPVKATLY